MNDRRVRGAFYTRPETAASLFNLQLDILAPKKWINKADFSCGKGNLFAGASKNTDADIKFRGFDIDKEAVRYTKTCLPEADISLMPLGTDRKLTGSIELLSDGIVTDVDGKIVDGGLNDYVVMNPPFMRARGGMSPYKGIANPTSIRKRMIDILGRYGLKINAGMAVPFVLMAQKFTKPLGLYALILPKSSVSGAYWKITRSMMSEDAVLYILTSKRGNFSENCKMPEVIIISRRLSKSDRTVFAVVDPDNVSYIPEYDDMDLHFFQGTKRRAISIPKYGMDYRSGIMSYFDDKRLATSAIWTHHLPSTRRFVRFSDICTLKSMKSSIPKAWKITDESGSGRPLLWGHTAKTINKISLRPNRYVTNVKDSDWKRTCGKHLISTRMDPYRYSIIAGITEENVNTQSWRPFIAKSKHIDISGLILWLNSTYIFPYLLSRSVETSYSWLKIHQKVFLDCPIPRPIYLKKLKKYLDTFSDVKFLPLTECSNDPVRRDIDDIIKKILGMPDITIMRDALSKDFAKKREDRL